MIRLQETKHSAVTTSLAVLTAMLLFSCEPKINLVKITILHTNDTHSHLVAFPENHPKSPLMGGYARRAFIIDSIRNAEENVLVVDCGDFSQGTPYYNIFKGEPEVLLMSKIKYDAVTLGNHEFDYGVDNLARILQIASFPVVTANYNFQGTPLQDLVEQYKTLSLGGIRIGVFGIGVPLQGLVPNNLFHGIKVLEPISSAVRISDELKHHHQCDLVICLSHLGLENHDGIDDMALAKNSSSIDLIIGGHSHTPLEKGMWLINSAGRKVLVAQASYGGVSIGKIDIYINKGA